MSKATALLCQAAALYDDPNLPFAQEAKKAWQGGFYSGAGWMELVLSQLRHQPQRPVPKCLQGFGIIKYTLTTIAALPILGFAIATQIYPLIILSIPAFYAVEVQMVFLFPITLDRMANPFRTSQEWTKRAGGTIAAMQIVLVLAAVMLFGGFVGQGFIRCWCLGCLAVVLWYEELRQTTIAPNAEQPIAPPSCRN